jgi:hypothetical protein
MTRGAVSVLRRKVMGWSSGFKRTHAMILAVALQTELRNAAGSKQSRIRRTVRRVT